MAKVRSVLEKLHYKADKIEDDYRYFNRLKVS
jgi:hypothetical protein